MSILELNDVVNEDNITCNNNELILRCACS